MMHHEMISKGSVSSTEPVQLTSINSFDAYRPLTDGEESSDDELNDDIDGEMNILEFLATLKQKEPGR